MAQTVAQGIRSAVESFAERQQAFGYSVPPAQTHSFGRGDVQAAPLLYKYAPPIQDRKFEGADWRARQDQTPVLNLLHGQIHHEPVLACCPQDSVCLYGNGLPPW